MVGMLGCWLAGASYLACSLSSEKSATSAITKTWFKSDVEAWRELAGYEIDVLH